MATLTTTNFGGLANGAAWPAPWAWRHGNNANAKAYVQDGFGRVYVAGAGQWLDKGYITHTTAPSDFEITLRLRGTTDSFPQVHWRTQGSSGEVSNSYCVLFDWDGKVHLYRNVNWTSTKLSSVTGRFSYNTWTLLRLRVQGSNFKARIWKDGASEPSTWDMDVTDSTHSSGALVLQGAGGAATSGFNIDFDDIVVSDFSAATTPVTIPSSAYPTATDAYGTANDKVNLTGVTGVIWTVDGADYTASQAVPYTKGTNTTVTARAAAGYTLSGTSSWALTFTNIPAPVPVTVSSAQAPTATDPYGTSSDTVTLSKVTGVTWTVDGVDHPSSAFTSDTKVVLYTKGTDTTVTAKSSGSPYVLSGTTSWPLAFTNIPEPPPPPVDPDPIIPSAERYVTTFSSETSVDIFQRRYVGPRYFATRLNGDGTESLIADFLPLSNVSITKTLSGVNGFTATLDPEFPDLVGADGLPVLLPWSSAVYVEIDGEVVHGALVTSCKAQDNKLAVTGDGFLGYLAGTPWTDRAQKFYRTDPADLMRLIWTKVQAHPGANLGLTLDTTGSSVDLGVRATTWNKAPAPTSTTKTSTTSTSTITTTTDTKTTLYKDRNVIETVVTRVTKDKKTGKTSTTRTETTKTTYATKRVVTSTKTYVSGTLKGTKTTTTTLSSSAKVTLLTESVVTDEPYVLADYATADLGQVFAELATTGSIDYTEGHAFTDDGRISHHVTLGFPRIGRRRFDIAFDTRLNVIEVPEVDLDVEDYASSVLVLASGEGDKMVRALAESSSPARLRRVRTVERKGIGRQATADKAAADYLKRYGTVFPLDVTTLVVRDSELAPMGSWNLGDEVRLTGPSGWAGDLDIFVRIVEETYDPVSTTRTLSVIRADRI